MSYLIDIVYSSVSEVSVLHSYMDWTISWGLDFAAAYHPAKSMAKTGTYMRRTMKLEELMSCDMVETSKVIIWIRLNRAPTHIITATEEANALKTTMANKLSIREWGYRCVVSSGWLSVVKNKHTGNVRVTKNGETHYMVSSVVLSMVVFNCGFLILIKK